MEERFSQGDRWKMLIRTYIQAMPPMGKTPGADEHIVICASFDETQAISVKVGEAAWASQSATSRDCCVSAVRFLASVSVAIFELPVELRQYLSALNWAKMYGRAAGERE
jgi:hypothetical protein